jgi:hypothetical protein
MSDDGRVSWYGIALRGLDGCGLVPSEGSRNRRPATPTAVDGPCYLGAEQDHPTGLLVSWRRQAGEPRLPAAVWRLDRKLKELSATHSVSNARHGVAQTDRPLGAWFSRTVGIPVPEACHDRHRSSLRGTWTNLAVRRLAAELWVQVSSSPPTQRRQYSRRL